MQRAEARLNRDSVGASDLHPSPHTDDAVPERKAKVFELVHRQQIKQGRPGPVPIVFRTRFRNRVGLSWTPPFPAAHTLEDPLSDTAGRMIVAMNAIPTWTREKRTIYENLLAHLKSNRPVEALFAAGV
jgi:hypothetical protein